MRGRIAGRRCRGGGLNYRRGLARVAQRKSVGVVLQTLQRILLDLAHALARDAEHASDLFKRLGLIAVEAVAQLDNPPTVGRQPGERLLERPSSEGRRGGLERRCRLVIGHAVGKGRACVVVERGVERDGEAIHMLKFEHLFGSEAHMLGDLGSRRLPTVRLQQVALRANDAIQFEHAVQWHSDRSSLISGRLEERLAYPPSGVRRELVAAAVVEPVGCGDEPGRALLNKIEHVQAVPCVAPRKRCHEAQVRHDQPTPRFLVSTLGAPCQFDLFIGSQETELADERVISAERIALYAARGVRVLDSEHFDSLLSEVGAKAAELVVRCLRLLREQPQLVERDDAGRLGGFDEPRKSIGVKRREPVIQLRRVVIVRGGHVQSHGSECSPRRTYRNGARSSENRAGMTEPKRPLELYGHPTDEPPQPETDVCPFLGARCIKSRKSEPTQTIGTCILGMDGKPQLVCPVRMRANEHQVLRDVSELLSGDVTEVLVVPEINIKDFGNVDFTLAGLDGTGHVVDFVGVEFQTNDTTGSAWRGRQDYFEGHLLDNYGSDYGLNWKMTTKLVLKQTLDKGAVFSKWGKKYVWAMQDTLLERMRAYSDMSLFHEAQDDDQVFFYAYEVFRGSVRYDMRLVEKIGSDLGGVAKANAPRTEIAEHVLETFETVLEAAAKSGNRGFRFTPS